MSEFELAFTERQTKEKIKLFPCWASMKKEKWLARMALAGWMLSDIGYGVIYRFNKNEKRKLHFAVEYLGKSPDIPGEIEGDRKSGWEYVGRLGKFRYYFHEDGASPEPEHPAFDNQIEPDYLRKITTSLFSLLLLNIPGTIFCIAYLVIFFANGGFFISDLVFESGNGVLYLFGAILGIVSFVVLFRWLIMARQRLKSISKRRKI